MDGNSGVMVGNLTRDIELQEITIKNGENAGQTVAKASFSLAQSWYVGQGDGRTQKAEFFDFEVWRDMAVNLANTASKGTRLMVEYRLRQDRWVNADGQARTKVRCEVINVAVDLRFATAEVHKNTRPDQPVPAVVGASTASEGETGETVEFSEEPF